MESLLNLQEETNLFNKIKNSFAIYGIYIVYAFIIYHIIEAFIPCSNIASQVFNIPPFSKPTYSETFFRICIVAPITEEIFFRVCPIMILTILGLKNNIILPCVVLISCFFGYEHSGSISILAQGVFGLLLSWNYIVNRSIFLNILTHFLWNFSLLSIFPYLIK